MNRTDPTLTLGIPVHNGAAYLEQLFECLRAQTFTDFEAIISDNASTDGTEQICRVATAADPRFRYQRNERNIGAAPNFNRVFEQGAGRYFKWTAHDDLLAPTYLERCIERLEGDPSVSVCHAAIQVVNADRQPLPYDTDLGRYIDNDGTPAFLREPAGLATSADPARRFDDVLHGMRLCSEIFGVMRTDLLRRTSLHGSYYGSDKVLLAELAMLGRIESVPRALVHQALPQGHVLLSDDPRAGRLDRSRLLAPGPADPGAQRLSRRPVAGAADALAARPLPGQRGPQDRQSPDLAPAAAARAGQLSGHRGAPRRQAHGADEAELTGDHRGPTRPEVLWL